MSRNFSNKKIVVNEKSEKFFLNSMMQARYNSIDKKNKAYMPYRLFEKRVVFRNTHIPPYVKGGTRLGLKGWGSA